MEENKLNTREMIDDKYKWSLEDIYPDELSFNKDFEKLKKKIKLISTYEGQISKDAKTLLNCLKEKDDIDMLTENLFVYARMKRDEDTRYDDSQKLVEKISSLAVEVSSILSFIVPEIIKNLDTKTVDVYINKEIGLKKYRHFFADLFRQKAHVLSHKEEKLLSNAGEVIQTPYEIFSMFNNADITFDDIYIEDKKYPLTHGNYITYLRNENRILREKAYNNMYSEFKKYKNTLAKTYSSNVKKNKFLSETRKYSSCLDYALSDDNIDKEVYNNLIAVIDNHLINFHKYLKLRKKALKLDKLKMYDVYVPIVEEVDTTYTFEEAKEIVIEALKPLGSKYIEDLKKGFNEGWIDVFENKGKRSGAYSWGSYMSHPYVLLNFQGTLDDIFTIAHEMGHAMHTYYSNKNQEYINSQYPIFLAEVASTTNELLLKDYLIKKTSNTKDKAFILNHFLEEFKGTVFRQTMFAEFESLTHDALLNGQSLTTNYISDTYYELVKKHFGKLVEYDDNIKYEWSRIPHFYTSFYVYKYATGFCSSVYISEKILHSGKEYVSTYLDFLKSGGSDYPLDILKKAGVDLTKNEVIIEALNVFLETVNQLDKILGDD